ncbi:unnamed protein product, partial [Ostreobium quekettii]
GRTKVEGSNLSKERRELEETINSLQVQIYKGSEKMDQFKLLMNWNQDELDQWAQAQWQKEQDNLALEKYKRQDESVVKDLNLQIERDTKNSVKTKSDLAREVTETQAAQTQLDKTADDFRALHKERQELLRQWDEAVEAMRRQDKAIQLATERFHDRKSVIRQKRKDLDAQAAFLENEVANNRELEARIEALDRETAKLRDLAGDEQKKKLEASDETEVLQNTLRKAANDLAQKTVENRNAKASLEDLRKRLDGARKKYAAVRRKLESEMGQLDALELRDSELKALHAAEERHLREAQKVTADLKAQQYRQGQALFVERKKERDLISEIAGAHAENRNMKAKIAQLEAKVAKQQEMLYNVEFQIVVMERKVSRAQGERSDEETRELNTQIERLTRELEGVNAEHAMLLAQLKKAMDNLGQASRKNKQLLGAKAKIEDSIAQLYLETEMIQKSIKSAVDEKENCMVEHDVLKLQVKRLTDVVSMRVDEVCSLENRKAQLQLSMEERKHEIGVHRDGLLVELKNVRDDVHRVILEQKERFLRAGKLKSKFETLSANKQSMFEDEPRSQAYFLIKAAQEREELQRQGDDLDAKIRKGEKEVQALQQTLEKLLDANNQLGASFRRVPNEASLKERMDLRERLDRAYDKLKFKRTEEMNIAADIQQAEIRLRALRKEVDVNKGSVAELTKKKVRVALGCAARAWGGSEPALGSGVQKDK